MLLYFHFGARFSIERLNFILLLNFKNVLLCPAGTTFFRSTHLISVPMSDSCKESFRSHFQLQQRIQKPAQRRNSQRKTESASTSIQSLSSETLISVEETVTSIKQLFISEACCFFWLPFTDISCIQKRAAIYKYYKVLCLSDTKFDIDRLVCSLQICH